MGLKMKFSIILRTKNEIHNIENFLLSVRQQTYKNYELIVMDNSSTDGTYEFCLNNDIKTIKLNGERIESGNEGMLTHANGDIVGYFDADMILSPRLIESCLEVFNNSHCVGIHIPEIILGSSIFSKVRRHERSFYVGTVIDAARFIRRDIVLKIGGFDTKCFPLPSAEDWDLDKRIKTYGNISVLKFDDEHIDAWDPALLDLIKNNCEPQMLKSSCFYHNEISLSFRKYLKKKSYYTNSIHNYVNKWGPEDPDLKKQLGYKYRLFQVFLENNKWKKLANNPVKTMLMYCNILTIGLIYSTSKILKNFNRG